MSSPPSALRRLFGLLWAIVVGVYRLVIALVLIVILGFVWMAMQGGAPKKVEENVALVIYPTGLLVDSVDEDPAQRFFQELAGDTPTQTLLRDVTDALKRGAGDPRVALAVLKLDGLWGAGLSQLQELGAAVQQFRAAGKPVYAYGPYYDQGHYLIAAHADHISLDPMGMVFLEGLAVYQLYFKEALDKLGLNVHVFRVGDYKSAVEPFERNDMSAEAREANRDWLNDLWQSYGRNVAKARKLPDGAVDAYIAALPEGLQKAGGDAAALAKDSKLVDEIETLADFRQRIADTVGWDDAHGSFRQIHFSEYLAAVGRERSLLPAAGKTIALVVVQGEIVDGNSVPGVAGAETIAELLTDARENESVAAVVLRVDSPGGSVFGSERIRRELQNLQADGKPVVVSMSSVAASGGYWVAMDADEIWAHDTTITGSIGIFALLPTFEKPLAKLGIHSDGLGTTALAGAFRVDRPLSPEIAAILQSQLEQNYRLFVEGVAAGRELPVEKVQEIARGRVWSGSDALSLGLIDQVGGMDDAVAAAVRLAGLEPGDFQLEEFKPAREFPFLRSLLDFAGHAGLNAPLAGFARELLPGSARAPLEHAARSLQWLDDPRGVYSHCFCVPTLGGYARRDPY